MDESSQQVDRRGRALRALRVSVTDRCNLRCSYCMPEREYRWLPRADLLTYEEIARLVASFTDVGVRRVRLTGGEPLLRRDLERLVGLLSEDAALDEVALTTNGVELAGRAASLRASGLSRLTVSLDTLRPQTFRQLAQRDGLDAVLRGIADAAHAGFESLKLDCVVVRDANEDELVSLLDFASAHDAELRFIEYMDVGGATRWDARAVVSRAEILERVRHELGTPEPLPGRGSAPAERFRLPDGRAFGVIASTTAPFCGACDRSRLTADGQWLSCLYATRGRDLRAPLRAGASRAEIAQLLARAWSERDDQGAVERALAAERGAWLDAPALRADPHLEMHTRGG